MSENMELFELCEFPTGRRLVALAEVRKRAMEYGLSSIAERAAQGLAHDMGTLALEQQHRPALQDPHGVDAPAMSKQLDRRLRQLDSSLSLELDAFPATHPRHQAAERLRTALFPHGIIALISAPLVQQYVEVNDVLERAGEADLARDAALVPGFLALLDDIRALNAEYGQSLGSYFCAPSMNALRRARLQGQAHILDSMVLILAHFKDAPVHDPERAYLLEPILVQNNEIARLRRRRQALGDLDVDDSMDIDDIEVDESVLALDMVERPRLAGGCVAACHRPSA